MPMKWCLFLSSSVPYLIWFLGVCSLTGFKAIIITLICVTEHRGSGSKWMPLSARAGFVYCTLHRTQFSSSLAKQILKYVGQPKKPGPPRVTKTMPRPVLVFSWLSMWIFPIEKPSIVLHSFPKQHEHFQESALFNAKQATGPTPSLFCRNSGWLTGVWER